ncbi:hypothetical protein [Streptacidiphilus sp. P02-A3a]|uniref:hypothetical protein n=1 Tax=Streptacidiphilus sp. P02-A3a TaxID=2704468 RepID=UPI0015FAD515|nr:hypothetical protein [Streptacidiphilus sp. P02-A3a]QMU72477.1 hypothetical protein GXP74_33760 [Streptacidiphilus sp. P02-A3a]
MTDRPLDHPGTGPAAILYEERRCANSWQVTASWVLGLLIIICGFTLAIVTRDLLFGLISAAGILLWTSIGGNEYLLHRRTGIRITTSRLTVGAVALVDDHDPTRPPALGSVTRLGRCAYSCDWAGIKSLTIVTDPRAIRMMRLDSANLSAAVSTTPAKGQPRVHKLGHLVPPYTKAVLMIYVDTSIACFPKDPHTLKNVVNIQSPTWIVPTRHPDALRRALSTFAPAASINLLDPLNYQRPFSAWR